MVATAATLTLLAVHVWTVAAAPTGRFDRRLWLRNPDAGGWNNARSEMSEDLLHNHLKRGIKREAVQQMLGEPDAQSIYDREIGIDSYDLGHIGPFGIDPSVLQIKYDSNARLIDAEIFET